MLTETDVEDHFNPSVRLLEIEKPETGSCGFHLTRGKWDPYPWISGVDPGTPAENSGMKAGDCLLEVNGEDIVGQRISEVAQLVRAHPNQVSLLLWNAGIDPQCSPEALCCGPMPNNLQRLSACMSSILTFLECPVCLDTTVAPTYQCDNGHLICMRCRAKSERCPVCRLRFSRGRSLLADQVYNALTDAFELREESPDVRSAKMQQIFKLRSKKIPGIKVTQAHTNKFLARLIGKSSSVDNLSTKNQNTNLTVDNEFSADLKTKSLSSSEIFHPASPTMSRTGSINGINRNNLNKKQRPTSYHGSFESLPDDNLNMFLIPPQQQQEGILYHCPCRKECSALIKGNEILNHFKICHEGPLIHYFKNKIKFTLQSIQEGGSYLINLEDQVFFLKITHESENISSNFKDTRIWVWLLGNKKQSTEYQLHINLFEEMSEGEILMSLSSGAYSLSSISWAKIKEKKKGVFISSQTLEAICSSTTLFDIEILKCDTQN